MHKERIDKRIKRRFQNLRLSGKLLVIYILAGFLPIMITLTITYHEMKKILWDRETMILESYLTQTTDALDNELEIYNNLSNYISYNQSIRLIDPDLPAGCLRLPLNKLITGILLPYCCKELFL